MSVHAGTRDQNRGNDLLPVLIGAGSREDRSRWIAGTAVTSYGVRIGLRVTDADLLPLAAEHLPFRSRPARSPNVDRLYSLSAARKPSSTEHAYLLEEDFTELARTSSLKDALETLERHAQLFVAEMAKSRIFVHAGVVCWRDRAVIIPGRSFSGKSTLVEALVRKGAVYYSDEYAVLDDRGQVYPFPRPLSVRDEKSRATPRLIEELGGRIGRSPAPVGLVVVTSYRPGARWRPRRLTPGRGALELLDNTVPARRQPEAALTAVQAVACRAPVLKGRRGEAADTALRILSKLDDRL